MTHKNDSWLPTAFLRQLHLLDSLTQPILHKLHLLAQPKRAPPPALTILPERADLEPLKAAAIDLEHDIDRVRGRLQRAQPRKQVRHERPVELDEPRIAREAVDEV